MTMTALRVLLIGIGGAFAAAQSGRAVADDRATTVESGGAGPRDINYVPSTGVSTTSNGQAIEATTPDVAVSSSPTTAAPAASTTAAAPAMTPSPAVTGTSSASPTTSSSSSFSSPSSSSATSSFSSSASGSSSMPF
jgi:hypothetical protein